MNKKVCLYRVQICNSPDSHYYLASDINAVFERKFDYKSMSVEDIIRNGLKQLSK